MNVTGTTNVLYNANSVQYIISNTMALLWYEIRILIMQNYNSEGASGTEGGIQLSSCNAWRDGFARCHVAHN